MEREKALTRQRKSLGLAMREWGEREKPKPDRDEDPLILEDGNKGIDREKNSETLKTTIMKKGIERVQHT